MIKLAGGSPVYIPLLPSENSPTTTSASWKLDMRELEKLFNSKTKAIVLNSPNNPLGKVFSRQELVVSTPPLIFLLSYVIQVSLTISNFG